MILSVCPNPAVDTYFHLDNLIPGDVNRLLQEQFYPGGKGVHVSMAAAELGEDVQLLGFWGGVTGDFIIKECEKINITCYGPQLEEWNRFCFNIKSESRYSETEILGRGPNVNKHNIEDFLKTLSKLIPDAQCLTLSGSWPPGADNFFYAEIIKLSHSFDCKVFLDCSGELLLEALKLKPFCVHINQYEADAIFGKLNTLQHLKKLANYCDLAVITVGKKGAYFSFKNDIYHAKCPVKAVYSSIGSGDCLLAGITVSFTRKKPLRDTIKLAVACGAANCIREELGMIHRQDVKKLFEQVKINKINE